MSSHRVPLNEQVLVITGASSGIGLATARLAAQAGAKVVLAARNERDLATAVREIQAAGGQALAVTADVSDPEQVEAIAVETMREYGRIDTWVNNAGVSLYGKLLETTLDDMHRQFEINFWGGVYGSLAAVHRMRKRGGTLINVASVLADRAIPLQGIYCASKHALKAFTDSLRMELEADRLPIHVCLVKPASMATPLFDKARTSLAEEPQPIPPVYAPEVAARTILSCAERPVREVIAGGAGLLLRVGHAVSPRLTDKYLERTGFAMQQSGRAVQPGRRDNLYEPLTHDGGERGRSWRGPVFKRSLYTAGRLHPGRAAWAAAGLGLVTLLGMRALRRRKSL
ncbi:MAG TPA: SDR family oxidoreductase [Gemmatimonadales bacterium]|jgi:short-subunit dehydrogenase|nr:SDR family oxidoreductase [Gemmatimonadales bacterium]